MFQREREMGRDRIEKKREKEIGIKRKGLLILNERDIRRERKGTTRRTDRKRKSVRVCVCVSSKGRKIGKGQN